MHVFCRKKKKQSRKPQLGKKIIEMRESINEIMGSFSGLSLIRSESINISDNPHKDLCVCKIWKRVIHRPVLLKNYQHIFCATCIFPFLFKKLETETKCTICCCNISLGSISKATTIQNILENIVLKCSNNTCNISPNSSMQLTRFIKFMRIMTFLKN